MVETIRAYSHRMSTEYEKEKEKNFMHITHTAGKNLRILHKDATNVVGSQSKTCCIFMQWGNKIFCRLYTTKSISI